MRKKDLKGDVELLKYPSHLKYLIESKKGVMPYHGVYCFCGKQGSGKTLSAVRLVTNILQDFPETILVTNVTLNTELLNLDKSKIRWFGRYYQMFEDYKGPVIYLIDEAHILFNSLNSRNTDVSMFQVISQNRKKKRVFILTSQVFNRLELFMREQINTIIPCNTYLNFLTRCMVFNDFEKDRDELVGKKEFTTFYTHKKDLHYKMYDTYQVIDFSKDSDFWRTKEMDRRDGINEFFEEPV